MKRFIFIINILMMLIFLIQCNNINTIQTTIRWNNIVYHNTQKMIPEEYIDVSLEKIIKTTKNIYRIKELDVNNYFALKHEQSYFLYKQPEVDMPDLFYSENNNNNVYYIRTNGNILDNQYPILTLISSVNDLATYYETNKNIYCFNKDFEFIMSKYNNEFFNCKQLIFVLIEENSGSNYHHLKDITLTNNQCLISINRLIPSTGTCDMAQWHLVIEVDQFSENNIDLVCSIDNQNF